VLRKIFGPKREKITGSGRDCLTRSFMNFTPQHLLLGDQIKKDERGGTCGKREGEENCIQGRPEGNRTHGIPRL
jgi:hypothetical protein